MLNIVTLWIHRAEASGILVHCYSNEAAYLLSCKLVESDDNAVVSVWDYTSFTEGDGCFHSASTPDMQLSIHPGKYVPAPFWNRRGTVLVSPEEALELGAKGEPEGYEPEESSQVWTKEKRTAAELDDELSDYFRLGELELKEVRMDLLKYAGMFGEYTLTDLLVSRDVAHLKNEIATVKKLYAEMDADMRGYTDTATIALQDYFSCA